MTGGNTPDEAFRAYAERVNHTLGCIASERVSITRTAGFDVGVVYTLALNRGAPVRLKGATPLNLSAGQRCRIVEDTTHDDGPYWVQVVDYWYVISNVTEREILTFHWTSEANPSVATTTPHLHVGSVSISDTAPLNPKTFNKLHIPTGYVSLQSVVRFLITDAGVPARRANWAEALGDAGARVGESTG